MTRFEKYSEEAGDPLLLLAGKDFSGEAFPEEVQLQPVRQILGLASFTYGKAVLSEKECLFKVFSEEFMQMNLWHNYVLSKNRRTSAGVSGLLPEAAAEFLVDFVRSEIVDINIGNFSLADGLRLAAEDLKAFYFVAVSARPELTDGLSLAEWFWGHTAAARVINEVRIISLKGESEEMQLLGKLHLVPENQLHRFAA